MTYLVSTLVSDEHYKGPVVLLDAIVNQILDPWVELLAHTNRIGYSVAPQAPMNKLSKPSRLIPE